MKKSEINKLSAWTQSLSNKLSSQWIWSNIWHYFGATSLAVMNLSRPIWLNFYWMLLILHNIDEPFTLTPPHSNRFKRYCEFVYRRRANKMQSCAVISIPLETAVWTQLQMKSRKMWLGICEQQAKSWCIRFVLYCGTKNVELQAVVSPSSQWKIFQIFDWTAWLINWNLNMKLLKMVK